MHYLDGNLELAELAYRASIESAHAHRFLHEEALAYELYGLFLLENGRVDEGSDQLNIALDKYEKWGALRKVDDLQEFILSIDPYPLKSLKVKI